MRRRPGCALTQADVVAIALQLGRLRLAARDVDGELANGLEDAAYLGAQIGALRDQLGGDVSRAGPRFVGRETVGPRQLLARRSLRGLREQSLRQRRKALLPRGLRTRPPPRLEGQVKILQLRERGRRTHPMLELRSQRALRTHCLENVLPPRLPGLDDLRVVAQPLQRGVVEPGSRLLPIA